jgi:hypothetical protein
MSNIIIDYDDKEGLHMISRGMIINTITGDVIAYPYNYSKVVITDNITENLIDIYGNELHYSYDDMRFIEGFEGMIIRLYQHNNKTYYSDNYRLDCRHIIPNISLPHPPSSSGIVQVFIVVHPELSMVSKKDIGNGFVMYMGSISSNGIDLTNVNTIDIEQANKVLSDGEFVIMYDIKSKELIRINSQSYQNRYDIYGNEPNIKLRLYQLLNYTYPWMLPQDKYDDIVHKYYESLSPYKQPMVMDIYHEILKERQDLIKHLQYINRHQYPYVTNEIIESAREYASKYHVYDTYNDTVDKFIETLVMNEDGNILYRMIHRCLI